ncbi:hypothetical protein ACFFRE_03685 [Aciditerrimonas ferrireducens]|uniref:Uncharacterized protein n=1 Tax=Aciditerrimonas ferrireducens TaxID=667306 RepID=A0ABV6C0Q0_9ACTN
MRQPEPGSALPAPASIREGPVPDWLSGAWWRTRLVIAGRVVRHAGTALWLQDGTSFLDLRGPGPTGLDGPRIFAGRTSWAPPHLRWHHLLDSLPADDPDVGRIARRDDQVLVESGIFPGPEGTLAYRERWERLLGPDELSIRLDDQGVLVRAARPLPLELRVFVPAAARPRARDPAGHHPQPTSPVELSARPAKAGPPHPPATRSNP